MSISGEDQPGALLRFSSSKDNPSCSVNVRDPNIVLLALTLGFATPALNQVHLTPFPPVVTFHQYNHPSFCDRLFLKIMETFFVSEELFCEIDLKTDFLRAEGSRDCSIANPASLVTVELFFYCGFSAPRPRPAARLALPIALSCEDSPAVPRALGADVAQH